MKIFNKVLALSLTSAGIIGLTAVPALAASPFANGSFENGVDPGSFTQLNAVDSATINNWSVTSGSVDYIGSYWAASQGTKSLDLSGLAAGAISQTFDTVAGHVYSVSFDLAGNPDGGSGAKTLNLDSGGASSPFTFNVTSQTKAAMGWLPQSYSFTASSSSTTLTFTSTTNTAFGPALDNVALSVNPPTKESQCKHDGWKEYTNPSFSSQHQCKEWVEAEAHGKLEMASPSQKIIFNVSNNGKSGHDNDWDEHHKKGNHVEYWNFDYPGGLHYKADVLCAFVNPSTKEARFMYQIPAGFPGLSGLYVLAYVKEVKNAPDLYGHTATADLNAATLWCQTGNGFTPTMYPVTKGHVEVESE